MPPAGSPQSNGANYQQEEAAYPSRNIAYQAAGMITSIIQELQAHDELRYTPAFVVYSLFSALIMHVYQMRSSNKSIVAATEQRLQVCMQALREVSKVWLVAKMVHTLFESILGNKHLEERLQKAAGRKHHKRHQQQASQAAVKPKEPEAPKRKFDDMDMSFANGPPAPQMSYERSRPQTPALTPSRELPQQQGQPQANQTMPQMAQASPQMPRQNSDAFMGGTASRGNTRPTTPFQPTYSYPGTPPELFLVTRNSPNISQDLWQNFQPDQLFPSDSAAGFQQGVSPVQTHAMVDPQLQHRGSVSGGPPQHVSPPAMQPQQGAPHHMPQGPGGQLPPHGQNVNGMHDLGGYVPAGMDASSAGGTMAPGPNDETWSNSSKGYVPTTLNVEDWYVQLSFSVPSANFLLVTMDAQLCAPCMHSLHHASRDLYFPQLSSPRPGRSGAVSDRTTDLSPALLPDCGAYSIVELCLGSRALLTYCDVRRVWREAHVPPPDCAPSRRTCTTTTTHHHYTLYSKKLGC